MSIEMGSQLSSLFIILFVTLSCFQELSFGLEEPRKLYVAYLGERENEDPKIVLASHLEILTSVHGNKKDALKSIVYSYKHGFSGFAAMLTETQASTIAGLPEVIRIVPDHELHVHTTRSWDFLGLNYDNQLPKGLLHKANYGDGIIIGVIDSGIWPESRSFDDAGYGPVPSRWRGKCQAGAAFHETNCNRKIIGARWYSGGAKKEDIQVDYLSPRDFGGHGTHTASTAAGNVVTNASFHGLAAGIARGGAPKARLAIYKAIWGRTGRGSLADAMKAVDDAIHDGVDILSLSLGFHGSFLLPYATLHAVMKGITVVFAAGNDGPAPQTVDNDSPWVVTVAASTMDRSFPTVITLGNNQKVSGQSIFYGNQGNNNFTELVNIDDGCDETLLNRTDIVGKIILCSPPNIPASLPRIDIPNVVLYAQLSRVKGLIYAHYSSVNILEFTVSGEIPYVLIDFEVHDQILKYYSTERIPVVKIEPTHNDIGNQVLAPKVAAFSSRGPSPSFPGLLKPDIAAPGASILAAYRENYQFNSGTSMACPHVTGIAALLKSLHPDWSPAAIKSAIVTSASITDAYSVPIEAESIPRKLADPFDFGGGHIDPNRAADPGLILDIHPKDYLKFFECGYINNLKLCAEEDKHDLYNLNLPSIAIPDLKNTRTVSRTVTNVGKMNARYKAVVQAPPGVKMTIEPSVLYFNALRKTQSFNITFVSMRKMQGDFKFGSLSWVEERGKHSVRIPVAIRSVIKDFYADII